MERVLKPFVCRNVCRMMDQDAICGVTSRRPHSGRRRTRSTGSLPWGKYSGESSSSMGEWEMPREVGVSSLQQSDSDDVSGIRRRSLYRLPRPFPTIESDSVNENFSPISRSIRRKRKLKRMAVDVEMASTSTLRTSTSTCTTGAAFGLKKKRIMRHAPNCENRYCSGGSSGKRKRSSRSLADTPRTTVLALHRLSLKDDARSHPPHSSSSLSSSESDTGIYTNDEGREGDDEFSDWVGEGAGGGGCGGGLGRRERALWEDSDRGESMEDESASSASGPPLYHALFTSRSLHQHRIIMDRISRGGREIRGGRRRLRTDKASFSVLTSANEKLSKFLQDPDKSQLRLHPMLEHERNQLGHLAELYSLDMRTDETKGMSCPILTKTSNTVRGEPVIAPGANALAEVKKRKCTPTHSNSSQPEDCDCAGEHGELVDEEMNETQENAASEALI